MQASNALLTATENCNSLAELTRSGDATGVPALADLLNTLPCDVLRDGIWLRLSQQSRVAMRSACKALRDSCDLWMTRGVTISLPFSSNQKIKGKRKQRAIGKGDSMVAGLIQKLSMKAGKGDEEDVLEELEDPLVSLLVRYMRRTGQLRALRFDTSTYMPRGLAALHALPAACPRATSQLQEVELMGVQEHELGGLLEELKCFVALRHVTVQLQCSIDPHVAAAHVARHLPHLQTWGLCVPELATESEGTQSIPATSSAAAAVSADAMLARLTKLRMQGSLRVTHLEMLATCVPQLRELGLSELLLEPAEAPASRATPLVLPFVHTLNMRGIPRVAAEHLALMLRLCPALTSVKLDGALGVQGGLDMAHLEAALRGLEACVRKGGAVSTTYTSHTSNAPSPLVQLDGVVLAARRVWAVGDVLATAGFLDVAGGLGFTDLWADQWQVMRDKSKLATAHPPTVTTLVFDTPNYALEADTWAWVAQFPRLEHLIMVWAPLGDAAGLAKLMMGQWSKGPRAGKTLRVTLVRHQHRRGPCEDEKQLAQLLGKAGPQMSALLRVIH